MEPEAERAYDWSTLALYDQAEEVLVVAADDHGCRVWSARSLYERLGAGAVHLHPVLTNSGLRPERQQSACCATAVSHVANFFVPTFSPDDQRHYRRRLRWT